jgi:glycosyltransferase involved in cell wall biosynthesis
MQRVSGPTVTVIVPLKHYEVRLLRACFASLFAQTSAHWRCIVVVEPADAESFRDVLAAELRDSRITFATNEGRKLAGAINTGIRSAETAFVALLLGDDLWSEDAVAVLTRAIESRPEVDFFHSSLRIIEADGTPCGGIVPSREHFTLDDFVRGSPVKHLLCFRRAFALALGGLDESLDRVGPDDYDFPWTMAEHGARFHAVPECLYIYRDHREGYRLTTHLPRSVHSRQLVKIMRKHGVSWRRTLTQVLEFRRGYLRQCLFRNAAHKWLSELVGYDARAGWRETTR